jgi:hypothetical protein
MRLILYGSLMVAALFLGSANGIAQPGGGCSPAATNGSCALAIDLVPGAACVAGTTCAGGAQAASTCLYTGSQCAWYRFTATATSMFVNIAVTATSGCHISSNVYSATGSCAGLAQISCLSGAPLDDLHSLTGLVIGALYYVQVCYSPGGPCGNGGAARFCIQAGVPAPPCNTCATPCGTATGFATTPTTQQVVDACQTAPFVPPLQAGSFNRFCYSFTATSSSVSFNIIVTSNCSGGNVSGFAWDLYASPSCGTPIQSGTLASLNFTGLFPGNNYVFCYSFTIPSNCTHSRHCPYFVGASTPLPVTWLGISAQPAGVDRVLVEWMTGSENGNDHFQVERSPDVSIFQSIGTLMGAGNSPIPTRYSFTDHKPLPGISYYRVTQVDHDGTFTHSAVVPVDMSYPGMGLLIAPNPVDEQAVLTFHTRTGGPVPLEIWDAYGRRVLSIFVPAVAGLNSIWLETGNLAQGMHILTLGTMEERQHIRFIKE